MSARGSVTLPRIPVEPTGTIASPAALSVATGGVVAPAEQRRRYRPCP